MPNEYEYDSFEKYWMVRDNFKDFYLNHFSNTVSFNEAERTVLIKVTDKWEYPLKDKAQPDEDMQEENNSRPFTEEMLEANGNDFLYRDVFHISIQDSYIWYESRIKVNWYSNMNVKFPIGEGLLDFCYADFIKGIENVVFKFNLKKMLDKIDPEDMGIAEELPKEPNGKPVIKNADDRDKYDQHHFDMTMSFLDELIYSSVYSAVFPPLIIDINEAKAKHYIRYIGTIKAEMLRRIEFVFDDEFYPDELSKFKPHERFALYCRIYGIPTSFERTEYFSVRARTDDTTLKTNLIPIEEIIERLQSHVPAKEQSPLEKALNLEAGMVNVSYHVPTFMSAAYECRTVHDMLELEFSKMLEYGIKLHKCKNCGRYFIVKGNYDAEYCDRVREGQNKNND